MRIQLLAVCVGLGSVAFWPELPPVWAAWFVVMALAAWLFFFARPSYLKVPAGLVIGCCLGVVAGHQIVDSLLEPSLELQDVVVTGRIEKVEVVDADADANSSFQRFEFSVFESMPAINAKYLRLSWHQREPDAPALVTGQTWQLPVRLRRPRGFSNPHGFDYGRWLVRRGIDATGYVNSKGISELLAKPNTLPFRERRLSATLEQLQGLTNRGVLLALAMGERNAVDEALWENYVATGTAHLMAISGLHIGIAAMMGFLLGAGLVRVFGRGVSWLPVTLALAAALYYAALAGFSLPTQRAVAMTAVGLMAVVLRRQVSFDLAWLLALFVVLLLDPLAPHSAGFWLSFTAVGALLLVFGNHRQQPFYGWGGRIIGGLRAMLQAQWAVFIGLLPVLAIGMGQISLASLPANLLCIPLFSFVIVPLVLLALVVGAFSPSSAQPVWQLADALLTFAHQFMSQLADLPGATVKSEATLFSVPGLLAVVGAVILLLPKALPARWTGAALLLPMLLHHAPKLPENTLQMTIFDVGQGLSITVRVADKTLVYDLGPEFSQRFNTADSVLRPYLIGEGIEKVDRLIISHADRDHAGGADRFVAATAVADILLSEPVQGVEGRGCKAGQQWRWGAAEFSMLHPVQPQDTSDAGAGNNGSCVLLISFFNTRILLTGDIEADAERALLERGLDLNVDIMTAPHHGSGTSSIAEFIAATSPAHVIYSAGYKHHFGHPKDSVVGRYLAAGAKSWSTAEHGAIEFVISNDGIKGRAQRERRVYFDPRYNLR